jgi:predicted ATPase/class 3 adenylate cyclase
VSESPAAVTYLFSDIEGSTRLWETEPQRIGPALARHDQLARETVEKHGGRVVKMTGDGVHAAFDDAAAAIAAVLQFQLAMTDPPDGMLPLKLRCGLHLGVDQRRDGDFFGPAVNRAARVMQAAHGGQVLLSQPVAERVERRLPEGTALRDLGVVRLRDLTTPERLYQLVHERLRADFPALRSLASTPNNLAQQLNSFIGREQEIQQVKALLKKNRLVTLLAMGGIGKSRLSVQLGAEVLDDYPDGVWLIELAPLTDPAAVAQAVAGVLGVKEEAGGSVTDALLRFVRERELLIILDNCEHLVHAAADLTKRLLQAGPRVTVLASSRDALQVAGERIFLLQPLSAPTPDDVALDRLTQHESVRLFVDRASAVQPSFHLSPQNAAAVADICHRLDGIALAIELAAARMRVLSADAIASRLNDRFRLLTTGDRTVLPRQRTLRALIDWSYDLLTVPERAAFGRLSVFAGGWTLEAAEEIAAGEEIAQQDVLDLMARLVEKSLVVVEPDSGRYRMLDTVRQYAAEQLAASPQAATTRARHLAFFVALAEQARRELAGPQQGAWHSRLDVERDNLLAAHAAADAPDVDPGLGLRLVLALPAYWINRGLLMLGYRLTSQALARSSAQQRDDARCRALFVAGQLSYYMGRYAEAQGHLEECVSIGRETASMRWVAGALQVLGMVCLGRNDVDMAQRHLEEAVQLTRAQGNPREVAAAINSLAQLHRTAGRLDVAAPLYEQTVQIARELEDDETMAIGLLNLAMTSIGAGDLKRVPTLLLDTLDVAERLGSMVLTQSALDVCAGLASVRGEWQRSLQFFDAAQVLMNKMGLGRDPADAAFVLPLVEQARSRCAAPAHALSPSQATEQVRDWLADCAGRS